jgi:phosphoserine phosphatase
MWLPFRRKHGSHKIEQLDAIEEQAAKTHRRNVNRIVKSRQKADTLKKVLKENNITIELAKAIGH